MLLDAGYIIARNQKDILGTDSSVGPKTDNNTIHLSSIMNYSKNYVKSTKSNAERDLGEEQLARKLAQDYEVVKLLATHNCTLNKGFRQLQR